MNINWEFVLFLNLLCGFCFALFETKIEYTIYDVLFMMYIKRKCKANEKIIRNFAGKEVIFSEESIYFQIKFTKRLEKYYISILYIKYLIIHMFIIIICFFL